MQVERLILGTLLLSALVALPGCHMVDTRQQPTPYHADAPRELQKVSFPQYVIEPPDILLIEAVDAIRRVDDPLRAGDILQIQVTPTIPPDPGGDPLAQQWKQINGLYPVLNTGCIDLGPEYGVVRVHGMSLGQARLALTQHLATIIRDPQVLIAMPDMGGKQHIAGEHLVRLDGTVGLGIYGDVYLAGLHLDEAKRRIEQHLSRSLHAPEVSIDVLAYNSKVFYVITDGGGAGEQVFRFPCTGNETVLDALSQINGLPAVSSKKDIWIARPAPPGAGPDQILPVDWNSIVQTGATATNYQVLPGDRIYVKADDLVALDTFMAKVLAPVERLFGITLLGNGTVRALQNSNNGNSNNSNFNGF